MTDFNKGDIVTDGEGRYRIVEGPFLAYFVHDELDGDYVVRKAAELKLRETAADSERRNAVRDAIRAYGDSSYGANPTAAQVDTLADAVMKALSTLKPAEVVDGDGDIWTRQDDGRYRMTQYADGRPAESERRLDIVTFDEIRERYGVKGERR